MMATLYLVQFLLVGWALAVIGLSTGAALGMRPLPWATLCAAITPHALASATLALAWLWPGAPSVVFLAVPGVVAVAVLIMLRRHARNLAVGVVAVFEAYRRKWPVVIVAALALLLCLRLLVAAWAPVTGHDALVYLAEAKAFAGERTISAIPDFEAGVGQIVKTHPHQFLWQAYLAQALMATDAAIGFPNDNVARGAILATLPLLVGAITALAFIVLPAWTAFLALPLTFLIAWIGYIPSAGSLDAFRIIPFVGAVALILSLVGRKKCMRLTLLVPVGIFTAFAAGAHTINVVFLAILFGSLLPLALLRLIAWHNLMLLGGTAFLSMIPTFAYYGRNWLRYGTPFGLGFDYYFYQGTPLWEGFSRQGAWTALRNPLFASLEYMRMHGIVVSGLAVSASAFSFRCGWRRRAYSRLVALAVIFLLLLLLPLLPLGRGVTFQGAMLSNFRYGLLVFALAPPLIAGAIGFAGRWLAPFTENCKPISRWAPLALSLLFSIAGGVAIFGWRLDAPSQAKAYLDSSELFVVSYADRLQPGQNWAVDRYSVAYLANRRPVKLTSTVGRPLMQANTIDEVERRLDEMNIRMVALYLPDWWESTVLFRALDARLDVERHVSGYWRVFILPADAPGRTGSALD